MKDPQHTADIPFQAGCSPVCDIVRKPKRRKRKARPWHRWMGMLTALPLVWVLITGVVLNHSEDWGLDEKKIDHPLAMSAYGMEPTGEPEVVKLGGLSVVHWDGIVFYDGEIVDVNGKFLSASQLENGGSAIVTEEEVLLVDDKGQVVEKLDSLCLPELPLLSVGLQGDAVVLKNKVGWSRPDEDWIEYENIESVGVKEIGVTKLEDEELKAKIARQWSGGGLPASRVILDLHAGNFLGSFAKYFYDFVALCTLVLIGTGIVVQWRMVKRNNKK